jgi:hypothetical protein
MNNTSIVITDIFQTVSFISGRTNIHIRSVRKKETISNEQPPRKIMAAKKSLFLDCQFTFSPYSSSKHFICMSSPLAEGNPGT